MSNSFDRPLQLELGASRTLLAAGAALYLLTATAWWPLPLAWWARGLLYATLAGHFLYLYGLHIGNRLPRSIAALGWEPGRGWWLQQVDGVRLPVRPCTPVFVSRHLVAVRFRTGRLRTRSVIVVADRLRPSAFRRLRVRLIQSADVQET